MTLIFPVFIYVLEVTVIAYWLVSAVYPLITTGHMIKNIVRQLDVFIRIFILVDKL